jgi:hypothetical protein
MAARSTLSGKRFAAPNKCLRKRLFVDFRLQGTIAARVVLYWLGCQFLTAVLLFGFKAVTGGENIAEDMAVFYRCALFGTLGFLPLAVIDMVRLSHRFAGPMLRFRRAMHDLGCGKHVAPLRFRDGDFWQDLATDFNAVLERVPGPGGNPENEAALAATPDETLEPASASCC